MAIVAVVGAWGAFSLGAPQTDDPPPRPTGTGDSSSEDERPNVLIVLTDDQSASMMKVMRKTRSHIGSEGVEFPNAVVTTPLCCPSRATILSGRYAHNHGVTSNGKSTVVNFDGRSSLATVLQGHGYLTGISGKYLNAWPRVFEKPHGFDRWAVYDKGVQPEYRGVDFNVDGEVRTIDEYSTSFTERKALEYLDYFHEIDPGAPWFLEISPHAPHSPATPESKYETAPVVPWNPSPAFMDDASDKPEWVRGATGRPESIQAELNTSMQRTLLSVDDMVGAVLQRLEQLGDADNTLMFFTSDNGFLEGEHGLRGKRPPYDASVQVPFLMRWTEGGVERGISDQRLVANVDIAPTVYDAVGIDPEHQLDGRSLLEDFERKELFVEYFEDPGSPTTPGYTMLWHPDWSFIRYRDSDELEFYGRDDPHQLTNVYGDGVEGNEPTNEEELLERLDAYESCSGEDCP